MKLKSTKHEYHSEYQPMYLTEYKGKKFKIQKREEPSTEWDLLIQNLDNLIPGARLWVMQKRGIFKTTKSRRGVYSFSSMQIAEIEYRYNALEPYLVA